MHVYKAKIAAAKAPNPMTAWTLTFEAAPGLEALAGLLLVAEALLVPALRPADLVAERVGLTMVVFLATVTVPVLT